MPIEIRVLASHFLFLSTSFVLLSFQSCCKAILLKLNNDICLDLLGRSFLILCPPSLLLVNSFHLESTTFDFGGFPKNSSQIHLHHVQDLISGMETTPTSSHTYLQASSSFVLFSSGLALISISSFPFYILPLPSLHPSLLKI